MTKTKKWSLAAGILLIGMIISFVVGFFPKSVDVHAEENYYSAEQYTENDRLLQPDGTRSNRNIRHFANDVKQSGINRSFPERAHVGARLLCGRAGQVEPHRQRPQDRGMTLRCGGDPNGSPPLSFGYNFRIRQSFFAQIRVILPCAECRGKSVRD